MSEEVDITMNGANDKLAGQQIDQYRVLEHIARGGMADVYLAEDVDLQRKIALKVMLETLAADTQFVRRFRREAQAVARLDHPNIVQVYTVGQTPTGRPYIAMQFIEGGSLREKLQQLAERGKLLTTEQALNIARQIAEALAVAHNAHIIHRDLKPGNVLIRPDGKPVLVDLGIAAVKGTDKLTQTGGIIGTPHYMSPEQVKGEQLDGRSDLYSLGIILYEMLAGIRPFAADSSIAVLHQQVYEEPIFLGKRRPDLPPQVTAVVETCLKKELSERFLQAEAMITAIDQALQVAGKGRPNPQATQVLTHLNSEYLISRQQVVRAPTGEQSSLRHSVPVWAIVTLVVLAAAIALFYMLRPSIPVTNLSAETTAPTPVPEIVIQPTDTDAPTETAVPTRLPTSTPIPTTPPPTPTETAAVAQIVEFTVSAAQARNETGLQIEAGQNVTIEYMSGSWRAGPLPAWPPVGPNGDPQVASKTTFPVPAAPIVSLIVGVGSQPPQLVGERLQFQSKAAGQLWLGANDDGFADNVGSLTTRIIMEPVNESNTVLVSQFQPVSLGEYANAQTAFASPPVGNVTLGNIPFELSTNIFKSQASPSPFNNAPVSIQIPVTIPKAYRIHLLLNTGNGYKEFTDQVIGQITVNCGSGLESIADLRLGNEVREWHNAGNVVSTAVRVQQVWKEFITDDIYGYIDLLTLDLPPSCQNGSLTSIAIVDTSVETVGSLDPAINLVGITVEHFQ